MIIPTEPECLDPFGLFSYFLQTKFCTKQKN